MQTGFQFFLLMTLTKHWKTLDNQHEYQSLQNMIYEAYQNYKLTRNNEAYLDFRKLKNTFRQYHRKWFLSDKLKNYSKVKTNRDKCSFTSILRDPNQNLKANNCIRTSFSDILLAPLAMSNLLKQKF